MRQTLRPDQERVIAEVQAFMRAGCRRILVWAPTGMGKTTVMAAVAERAQQKALAQQKTVSTWVLVHRHEIAGQAAARISGQGVRVGVIMGGEITDPEAPTQVISLQTLSKRVTDGGWLPAAPSLVFVDEAHHLLAETWWAAVEKHLTNAVLVMLSATPWGPHGEGLGLGDALVKGATQAELVAMGVLVAPEIYCGPTPDLTKIKVRGGDFAADMLAAASTEIVGDVVETWQRLAAGKRTLAFAVNLAHSMALVERFKQIGVVAEHVDWSTDPDERRGIFGRLASGETTVVSNMQIVTEGFDCPAVDAVVLARATRSDKLYLQMVGRGLRAAPGKTSCMVLDHGNNAFRHGHPFNHRHIQLVGGEDKKSTPKEKDVADQQHFILCLACSMANIPKAMHCAHCGAIIARRSPPKEKRSVALVKFEDLPEEQRDLLHIMERRTAFYRLVEVGRKKNWGAWQISYRYKAQFGIMPHEDQIFLSARERGMYWQDRKKRAG